MITMMIVHALNSKKSAAMTRQRLLCSHKDLRCIKIIVLKQCNAPVIICST